jgi:hypothetical protein
MSHLGQKKEKGISKEIEIRRREEERAKGYLIKS